MTTDAIAQRIRVHVASAAETCSTLTGRNHTNPGRYAPPDILLAFLEAL
jgi:hypothetical protein